ncbi:hypothetical protein BC629DRAFT_1529046, partial [Irpex lacteus]
ICGSVVKLRAIYRMERLKKLKENGHGRYDEIMEEKVVLQTTIEEPLCIIHFYMPNFRRCTIMDRHLEKLAPKYFSTRFLRVCVENVPFLVEKLGIKQKLGEVLVPSPSLSRSIGSRLVGFEDLGNKDNFETSLLERKLLTQLKLETGVIRYEQDEGSQQTYTTSTTTVRQNVRGGPAKDDFELTSNRLTHLFVFET